MRTALGLSISNGPVVMTSDATAQGIEEQPKAKVFISHSRKDMAFADQLDLGLGTRGYKTLIDRSDILAFEEWWKRVEALIVSADTVVFVISPDAVRPGTVALKEVAFAASLNKRFAPIVLRRVDDKYVPGSTPHDPITADQRALPDLFLLACSPLQPSSHSYAQFADRCTPNHPAQPTARSFAPTRSH
jgi:hypothetical protein